MKHKAPTLREVAQGAKCSVNTASLALRNSPRISPATRKRVRQAARKLKYVPDTAARNLASNRSGLIGVFTRALYDAVRTELTNALIAELHTAEYRPVLGLGAGHKGPWHTAPWMRTFQELKVDALVVVNEAIDRLPHWPRRVPIILVGCQPNESLKCDYLGLDRKEGARLGVEYLVSRGHRKILVACAERSLFAQGCFEYLRAASLKPYYVPVDFPSKDRQLQALMEYCTRTEDRPTAAIFGDTPLAAQFAHRIAMKGLSVPRDLAIVGYDYFPWADTLRVPLTTIEQPISEMASSAVERIRTRLGNPDLPPMRTVLSHKLVIRRSA